jgi:hypothetical protein
MFTHPLEVMKNHSWTNELKSHYELVGRDLAFYESKAKITKQKLKILFQYGQRARLKTALDDLRQGTCNNGINEGPSGTKKIYYNIP